MQTVTEFAIRFRTWLVNLFATVLIILPDLLSAPEILAVIPAGYQKYIIAGVFLLNIWMRPRPAVMARDLEK